MKKHAIISITIIILLLAIPAITYAALTASFGGKVLSTNSNIGTCSGFGVGPVILASNLESLGSAVISASGVSGQSTATRVAGTLSGLYGAIPFYTKIGFTSNGFGFGFVGSVPKTGDWILGRANIIPEFTNCVVTGSGVGGGTGGIPFPVRDSSNYQVSSHTSINRL